MLSRHLSLLQAQLDELLMRGFCIINVAQLKRWMGQQRLSKNAYRSIVEEWNEILQQSGLESREFKFIDNGHEWIFVLDSKLQKFEYPEKTELQEVAAAATFNKID